MGGNDCGNVIATENVEKEEEFMRTVWRKKMKSEIQKMRDEMRFVVNKKGIDRLLDVLDEIIKRIEEGKE